MCERLAKLAPLQVQDQVSQLLTSKSQYIDLASLKKKLEEGSYGENGLTLTDFLRKNDLLRDVQEGNYLQRFSEDFNSKAIDVLSLSELNAVIDDAESKQTTSGPSFLSSDQRMEMEAIVRHIDEEAKYISNERRSQLTIGEFISNHHYLNSGNMLNYTNNLVKK